MKLNLDFYRSDYFKSAVSVGSLGFTSAACAKGALCCATWGVAPWIPITGTMAVGLGFVWKEIKTMQKDDREQTQKINDLFKELHEQLKDPIPFQLHPIEPLSPLLPHQFVSAELSSIELSKLSIPKSQEEEKPLPVFQRIFWKENAKQESFSRELDRLQIRFQEMASRFKENSEKLVNIFRDISKQTQKEIKDLTYAKLREPLHLKSPVPVSQSNVFSGENPELTFEKKELKIPVDQEKPDLSNFFSVVALERFCKERPNTEKENLLDIEDPLLDDLIKKPLASMSTEGLKFSGGPKAANLYPKELRPFKNPSRDLRSANKPSYYNNRSFSTAAPVTDESPFTAQLLQHVPSILSRLAKK